MSICQGLWSTLTDSPIKAASNVSLYPFVYSPNKKGGSQRCKTDVHSKNKTQLIATSGYTLLRKPVHCS